MTTRKIGSLVRILFGLGIFLYVAYEGSKVLPGFDIMVMTSFFLGYFLWITVAEELIYQDPDEDILEDDDRHTNLFVNLAFLLVLFYATIDFVGLHYTRIKLLEPGVIYVGFAFFIVSCLVRWWGFRSIDKWYNRRLVIYEHHRLITDGAYQTIRNPLYLGNFLLMISISLVFNSWGAMALMLITYVPLLIYRTRVEEELMLKHFGTAYSEYMQRTKKLIPGIW